MNFGDRPPRTDWFILSIGNSRLHWAWAIGSTLKQSWDTPHAATELIDTVGVEQAIAHLAMSASPNGDLLTALAMFHNSEPPPLWIASVVPPQTELWQRYCRSRLLTLADVPLQNLYPTLGIDRALALWGAAITLGTPVLVIDAGTALTLTGADTASSLVGGAILPGLRLQYQTIAQDTAALPAVNLPLSLPARWATTTVEAIHSGILYGMLAAIETAIAAWLAEFPDSAIAFTGGDSPRLHAYLAQFNPILAARIGVEQQLLFQGLLRQAE